MERAGEAADVHASSGIATAASVSAAPPSDSSSARSSSAVDSTGPAAGAATRRKKSKPVPALDFFSPSFDPLLALNTPGLRPPIADVQPLLSVQSCRSLLPEEHKDYKPPRPTAPTTAAPPAKHDAGVKRAVAAQPSSISSPLALFSTAARIPPQLVTSSTPSAQSTSRTGPHALLQSLVASQQRCRVLLRSHHSLQSIVTGQLRAFDRHCSLYVVEAQHTQRTTAALTVSERQRRKAGSGRKWVWVAVQRRVGVWQTEWAGQMMIRGESVISVSHCSEASEVADALVAGIEHNDHG